jgi:hypothetical protein
MTARELDVDYADHRKNMQIGKQMVEFAVITRLESSEEPIREYYKRPPRDDPHRQP